MHVVIAGDVAELDAYLASVGRAMSNLSRAQRATVLDDLRRDTLAAAEEVGMRRALADLGDPEELARAYGGIPRPPVRRGRVAAAVAAVVLAGTAPLAVQQWLAVGRHPVLRVEARTYDGAYFSDVDPELALRVARDRTDPTTIGLDVRNAGRATVTIGPVPDPFWSGDPVWFGEATAVPETTFDGQGPRDRTAVTLRPGEHAVLYTELDPCHFQAIGGVAAPNAVTVGATSLGLTTTQVIRYDLGIGFSGACGTVDHDPEP